MKSANLVTKLASNIFPPRCSVVLVAAGSSSRMRGVDKILADLSGKPVILRAAEVFEENPSVREIIVVTRKDLVDRVSELLKNGAISKLTAVVEGGETRLESVFNGLQRVSKKSKLIAIHDGARPLLSPELLNATIRKAAEFKAAVPGVPVRDTIRVVEGNVGTSTPERSSLYAMQTPQIFDADLIRAAALHCIAKKIPVTDDVSCVETMGMKAYIVPGEEENLKITTRLDLAVANALARKRDNQ